MLDEKKQDKLAAIIPLGMQELPIHLEYRKEIEDQQKELAQLLESSNSTRIKSDKEIYAALVKFLNSSNIQRYGFAAQIPEFQYLNSEMSHKLSSVLVLVYPIDYDMMINAPSLQSATALLQSYAEMGKLVLECSKFLFDLGVNIQPHHPMGDVRQYHHILLPPHAVEAGLGEKGRTGLFIDHVLGPAVRLGGVSMELEVPLNSPKKRGITEFCHRCKYCVSFCPPNALPDGSYIESYLKGEIIDFSINSTRCFAYFEKHRGCGKCIINCILAEPDLKEIERRVERIESWYNKWIVSGDLQKMFDDELNNNRVEI